MVFQYPVFQYPVVQSPDLQSADIFQISNSQHSPGGVRFWDLPPGVQTLGQVLDQWWLEVVGVPAAAGAYVGVPALAGALPGRPAGAGAYVGVPAAAGALPAPAG